MLTKHSTLRAYSLAWICLYIFTVRVHGRTRKEWIPPTLTLLATTTKELLCLIGSYFKIPNTILRERRCQNSTDFVYVLLKIHVPITILQAYFEGSRGFVFLPKILFKSQARKVYPALRVLDYLVLNFVFSLSVHHVLEIWTLYYTSMFLFV